MESPTPSSEASSLFYDDAFEYYLEGLSAVRIMRSYDGRKIATAPVLTSQFSSYHWRTPDGSRRRWNRSSIAMLGGKSILPKQCNALILCFLGPRIGLKVYDRLGRTDSMLVPPHKVLTVLAGLVGRRELYIGSVLECLNAHCRFRDGRLAAVVERRVVIEPHLRAARVCDPVSRRVATKETELFFPADTRRR